MTPPIVERFKKNDSILGQRGPPGSEPPRPVPVCCAQVVPGSVLLLTPAKNAAEELQGYFDNLQVRFPLL